MVLALENQIFRLRKCPIDIVDGQALAALLGNTLDGIGPEDVHVQSLATEFNVRDPMRMATLWFETLPNFVKENPGKTQWSIRLESDAGNGSSPSRLLLDIQFDGFTPLSDVDPGKHEFDCVVISGLASHPFGSWKPKGNNKYMWIRDTLPQWLPNVRPILYGYDSTLAQSTSFQSIFDIASGLIEHLSPPGWSTSEMKPLVFLAHSLGGIVLKEALLTLAARGPTGGSVLDLVRGGILFGVPHRGMTQAPLLAMVKGQPNENLVKDLAKDSAYLKSLDDRFTGVLMTRQIVFNFAYETKTSPTVEIISDGSISRAGPHRILVDQPSATRGLYGSSQDGIFSIDNDHSNMVKFPDGSSVCENILKRLDRICTPRDSLAVHDLAPIAGNAKPRTVPQPESTNTQRNDGGHEARRWNLKDVVEAFRLPHIDSRYHGVEKSSAHTFERIFDSSSQLAGWMQQDISGLFWVNGKPGSGKSTLMKFIEDHKRTQELLLDLSLSADLRLIRAHHFLHLRGNSDQSSFVGLLQSILYQILNAFPKLIQRISPVLEDRLQSSTAGLQKSWTDQDLLRCLRLIMEQSEDDIVFFFLFDALDEFSGDTGFISKFLNKHLLGMAGPRTRVKILFSSRPWDVFLLEFMRLPTLQLQDHNEPDIVQYCHNRILMADKLLRFDKQELIPELAGKAEGVFVWVKLMMDDLINRAHDLDIRGLRGVLQSTPSDLNDFYASIIQRINHEDRLDAYVIFQITLATQEYSFHMANVLTLIYILAIHRCFNYTESREKLEHIDKKLFPGRDSLMAKFSRLKLVTELAMSQRSPKLVWSKPDRELGYWRYRNLVKGKYLNFEVVQDHIRKVNRCCGGLVEMTATDPAEHHGRVDRAHEIWDWSFHPVPRGWKLQLLHQTVLDFIKQPEFSHLLLKEKAHSVRDNRYDYLAKLLFTDTVVTALDTRRRNNIIGKLCRDAESSTGHGLSEFIDTIPEERFRDLQFHTGRDLDQSMSVCVPGPTSFALQADLILYFEDHSSALQNSPDTSLMILVGQYPVFTDEIDIAKRLDILRLALRLSIGSQGRNAAFRELMSNICALFWQVTSSQLRMNLFLYPWVAVARAQSMARVFLEMGQDPELRLHGRGLYSGRTIEKGQIDTKGTGIRWRAELNQHLVRNVWWRPIHSAPSSLTRALLIHGAEVNGEDIAGNTALDWLIAEFDIEEIAMRRGLLVADLLDRWHKRMKKTISDRRTLVGIHGHMDRYGSWGKMACQDNLEKIMVLIRHGGITKTSGLKVWHNFFRWIREGCGHVSIDNLRFRAAYEDQERSSWFIEALRDSGFDLGEVEDVVATLELPHDSTIPTWPLGTVKGPTQVVKNLGIWAYGRK